MRSIAALVMILTLTPTLSFANSSYCQRTAKACSGTAVCGKDEGACITAMTFGKCKNKYMCDIRLGGADCPDKSICTLTGEQPVTPVATAKPAPSPSPSPTKQLLGVLDTGVLIHPTADSRVLHTFEVRLSDSDECRGTADVDHELFGQFRANCARRGVIEGTISPGDKERELQAVGRDGRHQTVKFSYKF